MIATFPITIGDVNGSGIEQLQYLWASPGPALSASLDPTGVTANIPLGVPARLLGPNDAINNGSTVVYGSGPDWNGCPNATGYSWLFHSASQTQNLCACYPPRSYTPSAGTNGGGHDVRLGDRNRDAY